MDIKRMEEIYELLKQPKMAFKLNLNNYKEFFEFIQPKIKNPDMWKLEEIEYAVNKDRVFSINQKNELAGGTTNFYSKYDFSIVDIEGTLNMKFPTIEEIEEVEEIEENKEGIEEKEEMGNDVIKETLENKIINSILPDVRKEIMKSCKDLTQNLTTIVVKLDEKIIKQCTEKTHNKFKDLLTLVNNNIPAMLTGGAGSGKSSTCEKVAKVLRTRFLF